MACVGPECWPNGWIQAWIIGSIKRDAPCETLVGFIENKIMVIVNATNQGATDKEAK